jgi:hypothetical protein
VTVVISFFRSVLRCNNRRTKQLPTAPVQKITFVIFRTSRPRQEGNFKSPSSDRRLSFKRSIKNPHQYPVSRIQHPTSSNQHLVSRISHPASRNQHLVSRISHPASRTLILIALISHHSTHHSSFITHHST